MRESTDDLERIQSVLDDSYASAGAHMASIHTDAARVNAATLVERLQGMQVLVVATVTSDGRPLTGPVDSFLYRGRFHFGTAASAVRARHLARSSWVSATHVRGETLVVTVHGRAAPLDLGGRDAGFAQLCREHYGGDWDDWGSGSAYFAVEPVRMFAADMSAHTAAPP